MMEISVALTWTHSSDAHRMHLVHRWLWWRCPLMYSKVPLFQRRHCHGQWRRIICSNRDMDKRSV